MKANSKRNFFNCANYFCINVKFKDFDYNTFDIIESAYCLINDTLRNSRRLGMLYLNNDELKALVLKAIPFLKDIYPIAYF